MGKLAMDKEKVPNIPGELKKPVGEKSEVIILKPGGVPKFKCLI